ncbi:hypothetical protein [Lachnospira sp.]|jgi:hypothetical protein|uniref:hypothetical protein n=1 Tax=Lachnospira sp. TaxID=2049031 RepID=UPI00257C8B45|nr:hypothetical protein [Lachnospira sp.]
MYTLKIVYNSLLGDKTNTLKLKYTLEYFIPGLHIEIYDENIYGKERKRALQIKNAFGAKLVPFAGVYDDKRIIKGFYSEDSSFRSDNIFKYCMDNMNKINKIEIPVEIMTFDDRVNNILELKKLSKEEFLARYPDENIYNDLHNSKVGHIKITKISTNPGYLGENESREGFTPGFGEGISCIISNPEYYYYTSIIKQIDWENKIFYTLNSKYSFEFNESTDSESSIQET